MVLISYYALADIAESDVSDIYDYTMASHGEAQANKYLSGLDETLGKIIMYPNLGKDRDEIRVGLQSLVYEKHVIFYRVMHDHIRIVRILHERRDIPKYL